MNQPTTVSIFGQRHRVELVERDEAMFRGAPESAIGTTNLVEQVLRIRSAGPGGQSPDQERDTLLHEVLHALFHLYGLGALAKGRHSERLVTLLAPALLELLRRNPDLVTYLISEEQS